jgi:anti-sigma factor RsiW
MIDCPNGDVRDALPDYLHGRLDTARRAEVESHLVRCEACRAELSLLRDLRATMRRAPAVDIAAIAAAIPPRRQPTRRTWLTSWRAAAAIAAIAVGGTSIALLRSRAPERPTDVTPYVRGEPAASPDSQRIAATQPVPGTPPVVRSTPVQEPARAVANGELAMAAGAIGELSDRELSALVEGIESLDGLPSAEVEGAEPVSVGAQEGLR